MFFYYIHLYLSIIVYYHIIMAFKLQNVNIFNQSQMDHTNHLQLIFKHLL